MGCVATFDGKETGTGKKMGWRISVYEKWSERLKVTGRKSLVKVAPAWFSFQAFEQQAQLY